MIKKIETHNSALIPVSRPIPGGKFVKLKNYLLVSRDGKEVPVGYTLAPLRKIKIPITAWTLGAVNIERKLQDTLDELTRQYINSSERIYSRRQ